MSSIGMERQWINGVVRRPSAEIIQYESYSISPLELSRFVFDRRHGILCQVHFAGGEGCWRKLQSAHAAVLSPFHVSIIRDAESSELRTQKRSTQLMIVIRKHYPPHLLAYPYRLRPSQIRLIRVIS